MFVAVRADRLFCWFFLSVVFLLITFVLLSVRADTCFVALRSRTVVLFFSVSIVRDAVPCFFCAVVISDF